MVLPDVTPSAVQRSTVPMERPGRLMLQPVGLPCSSAEHPPIRAHRAPALFARLPSKLYAIDSPMALQPSTSPGM